MFDNLTTEILYYSVIPVVVIALITLFILVFARKKDNSYKYSYIIKIFLIIMDSLVLPLIFGYTIWLIVRYLNNGILLSNIALIVIFILLIIALITLMVIIFRKLYKEIDK